MNTRKLDNLAWLPNLVARLTVGFMFASGAVGKLGRLGAFTEEFHQLGIPVPGFAAPAVAVVELAGGLALMLGIGTRLAAALLAATMAGALATAIVPPLLARYPDAWNFPSNLFYAPEWLLICLLAWLVCAGAGKASLDAVLARRQRW
ncbi:DoxX family protein [Allokutzneria oryzae]|uniref:DoxX family protein n=1 Tax=Allokutzneria oryzae TaxID=1378989 RepID=A0ABV6A882_9PSEU